MKDSKNDRQSCWQAVSLNDSLTAFLASWEGPAVVLLSVLMAFSLPGDVLIRYSWLSSLVNGACRVFPMIEGFAKESEFPGVTKVYMTVMLIISPVMIRHVVRERRIYMEARWRMAKENPSRFLRTGVSVNVFFIFLLCIYLFVNKGGYYGLLPVMSGRISLAVFGLLYSGALVWFSAAMPISEFLMFRENRPLVIRG